MDWKSAAFLIPVKIVSTMFWSFSINRSIYRWNSAAFAVGQEILINIRPSNWARFKHDNPGGFSLLEKAVSHQILTPALGNSISLTCPRKHALQWPTTDGRGLCVSSTQYVAHELVTLMTPVITFGRDVWRLSSGNRIWLPKLCPMLLWHQRLDKRRHLIRRAVRSLGHKFSHNLTNDSWKVFEINANY